MRRAVVRTPLADAERVAAAVRPDNTPELTTRVEGGAVVTTVERETVGGLRATLDDYLVNLGVARRTAELARRPADGRSDRPTEAGANRPADTDANRPTETDAIRPADTDAHRPMDIDGNRQADDANRPTDDANPPTDDVNRPTDDANRPTDDTDHP